MRTCLVCSKRIPKYKPDRSVTCKVQCSNAYYHWPGKKRQLAKDSLNLNKESKDV